MLPILYSTVVLHKHWQAKAFIETIKIFAETRPQFLADTVRILHLGATSLCGLSALPRFCLLLATCPNLVSLTLASPLIWAGRDDHREAFVSWLAEAPHLRTLSLSTGAYCFNGIENNNVQRLCISRCWDINPEMQENPVGYNLVLEDALTKFSAVTDVAWVVYNAEEARALIQVMIPPKITHFILWFSPRISKDMMPYVELDSIRDPRIVWLQTEETRSRPGYTGVLPKFAVDRAIFNARGSIFDGPSRLPLHTLRVIGDLRKKDLRRQISCRRCGRCLGCGRENRSVSTCAGVGNRQMRWYAISEHSFSLTYILRRFPSIIVLYYL